MRSARAQAVQLLGLRIGVGRRDVRSYGLPVAVMRLLQLRENSTMLARAMAELGRVIKSLYLLS